MDRSLKVSASSFNPLHNTVHKHHLLKELCKILYLHFSQILIKILSSFLHFKKCILLELLSFAQQLSQLFDFEGKLSFLRLNELKETFDRFQQIGCFWKD